MRNNPALVAEAIDLSRHTVHKIHQNLPRWTGAAALPRWTGATALPRWTGATALPRWTGAAALPRCGAWVKTTAR